ncbi:hypothetical protein LCGC14_2823940 [marine sediment metagenome]|uniref:Uncharacterized protein n=1 Tax=marine sediment metagenome TaxID=412755 RepID=A0A0F9APN7_9ZZZZ
MNEWGIFRMSNWLARRIVLGLFILTCIPNLGFAFNLNQEAANGIAKAHGFILGQEFSLFRIELQYPNLIGQVELARAHFNSSFPDVESKTEKLLKQALDDDYQKYILMIRTKLKETLGRQQLTKESALEFIHQVKARSKGEIESPILEYLLAVNYASSPVSEFKAGFLKHYRTDSLGKSQGIKLKMKLPRSWADKEGERPHIVQKWGSVNGTGLEFIMLQIRDAQGYNPSRLEIKDILRSGEVKDSIPNGATYVNSGYFTVENLPGYWIHMTMPTERVGLTVFQEVIMYQIFFRGKVIGIMCQAGGPEEDSERVSKTFKLIQPLCEQVVNSIVLNQIY